MSASWDTRSWTGRRRPRIARSSAGSTGSIEMGASWLSSPGPGTRSWIGTCRSSKPRPRVSRTGSRTSSPSLPQRRTCPASGSKGPRWPTVRDFRGLLAHAHGALVKSGTTTMEAALAGVPMVVAYRSHPLTFWIARTLVDVEHVAMVNLVAGERLVPELLQGAARPAALADALAPLLEEGPARARVVQGLARVRDALQPDDDDTAGDRVAELAAGLLEAM